MNAGLFDVLHDPADDDRPRDVGTASTSSSTASSRNLSIRIGCPGDAATAPIMYRSSAAMSHDVAIARPPRMHDGRTTSGESDRRRAPRASSGVVAVPLAAWGMPSSRAAARSARDPPRGRSNPASSEDADAGGLQRERQFERRLSAVLHDAGDVGAVLLLARDDAGNVLERQRLEIQAIDRIVIGRHRLRVAADRDGLEALFAQGERRMTTAIVELEPLPDPVGTAAEDDDLLTGRRVRLALLLMRRRDMACDDSNSAAHVSMRL